MTSLPISSNTKTFHTAPSADGFAGSLFDSSCASTSVMGAFKFRMRFMLAAVRHVSYIRNPEKRRGRPICLSRNVTAMAT